jgi:hypothetical protein
MTCHRNLHDLASKQCSNPTTTLPGAIDAHHRRLRSSSSPTSNASVYRHASIPRKLLDGLDREHDRVLPASMRELSAAPG